MNSTHEVDLKNLINEDSGHSEESKVIYGWVLHKKHGNDRAESIYIYFTIDSYILLISVCRWGIFFEAIKIKME